MTTTYRTLDVSPALAGAVGGDVQIGEAYCRRYEALDNDQHAVKRLITITYFVSMEWATEHDEERAPENSFYDVMCQTETTECTDLEDPGGTEISSDYAYEPASSGGPGYQTVEAAQAYAYNRSRVDESYYLDWFRESVPVPVPETVLVPVPAPAKAPAKAPAATKASA